MKHEQYFIPPSTITYGNTPQGVAFQANLYSFETRELVGTVCNDGCGGDTYFRPDYSTTNKAGIHTYKAVVKAAIENHDYAEQYYEHLMNIAEGVIS